MVAINDKPAENINQYIKEVKNPVDIPLIAVIMENLQGRNQRTSVLSVL